MSQHDSWTETSSYYYYLFFIDISDMGPDFPPFLKVKSDNNNNHITVDDVKNDVFQFERV